MTGRRRKGRELHGLLLLDKPTGITSNLALQKTKRIFNAAKAGHTGTLDPLATGLLVICFGRATKISDYLLTTDKHYAVTVKLGVVTNTGDADGEVITVKDTSQLNDAAISASMRKLTGDIQQVPPMYSALKIDGKRLHQLAREGVQVERQARSIRIFSFQLIRQDGDVLYMQVHCSKGTYIRTLVEDLGKELGCGAHVLQLRRTALGPFKTPVMFALPQLEELATQGIEQLDAILLAADCALQVWPAISLSQAEMKDVLNGHPISPGKCAPGSESITELVRLYDEHNQFYGVGKVLEDGRIAPKRLN